MRLDGCVFEKYEEPGRWMRRGREFGYRAASCPLDEHISEHEVRAREQAARWRT